MNMASQEGLYEIPFRPTDEGFLSPEAYELRQATCTLNELDRQGYLRMIPFDKLGLAFMATFSRSVSVLSTKVFPGLPTEEAFVFRKYCLGCQGTIFDQNCSRTF